ncbi:GntR family transcriptional regulator [Azospirillum agricola]|uniref:GntR family transcriptional regulator n=1 Tax=Azospirillum agricola TaxID=1720247 RepID=UPI000A0EF4E7|nr:GntR family transcriptional regulator [Azospirillum agricola]SMH46494.1 transcriptional regulator, GntR family [Azospirillum lipoferum]
MPNLTLAPSEAPASTYDWIEGEILSGRLAPGSRIDLKGVAGDRAVPAAEVREAALRLASEGLASLEEGTILRVTPVSLADLKDLTASRIVIETEMLRQSIAAGDAAWADGVRAAFERLAAVEPLLADNPRDFLDDWERCNQGFHAALVAACPLRRLMRVNERLYKQHQRYRRLSLLGRASPRDVHAEHLALYEAALARDPDRAAAVLADHIGCTVDQLANGIRDGSWFGLPSG